MSDNIIQINQDLINTELKTDRVKFFSVKRLYFILSGIVRYADQY